MHVNLELIVDALSEKYGNSQKQIAKCGIDLLVMLLRKNKDYGDSVWKKPVLAPGLDPGTAILVRMSDKVGRINQLIASGESHVDESVADTMRDFAGYAILWLVMVDSIVENKTKEPTGEEKNYGV